MIRKIEKKHKNSFIRNVLIVSMGTAAAQAISITFAPIITRQYGPEAFGTLGIFLSIVSIIAPIAALTYPDAIILPKKNSEAKILISVSIVIALCIATLVVLLLILFNEAIIDIFNIEAISSYLYLLPLVIIFTAFLQVYQQWMLRNKQFNITAKIDFFKSLLINSSKVGIGWINPTAAVLIIMTTLGSALHAFMLYLYSKKSVPNERKIPFNFKNGREVARKYQDFPLYQAPQALINAISQSLPVLLLASFFGPASAGFYTIVRTVLGMPTQLLGKSVADVFYPRITEAAYNNENLTRLITRATLLLAGIGIIPFLVIGLMGPWIFSLAFGSGWEAAGEYARWMSLWIFFGFINRPSAKAIPVLKLQAHFLIYEIFSVFLRAGALFLGFYYYSSDEFAIMFFSVVSAALNACLIGYVIGKSHSIQQVKER